MADAAVTTALRLPRFDATMSAATVARDLVDLFRAVEGLPCKVGWVHQAAERQLVADADPTLAAAGRAIALAIDAEASVQDRQPYHSRQHFCEAMLAVATLCQLHGLPCRSAQLLLLAALVHDFGHDGRKSLNFRLERASMERATPHLVVAGVDAETRGRLAALVLATEPHHGVRAAVLAREFHATGVVPPPRATEPPELARLMTDPALARLALLLCEADVLPSVGLTLPYAMHLQQQLAAELGRALGPDDKLTFIDHVLAAGVIGPFFLPNVLAIRQQVARPWP